MKDAFMKILRNVSIVEFGMFLFFYYYFFTMSAWLMIPWKTYFLVAVGYTVLLFFEDQYHPWLK